MPNWLSQALALDDREPVSLPACEAEGCAKIAKISETLIFGTNADFGTENEKSHHAPAGLLAEWVAGFSRLSPDSPPCPAFRRWYEVYRAARRFLEEHAAVAIEHGWSTLELWGVHHRVGTIRLDCSGALMISGGVPVVTVAPDRITYGNGLVFYRDGEGDPSETVPAWEFRP